MARRRRRARRPRKENPIELLPLLLILGGAAAAGGVAYLATRPKATTTLPPTQPTQSGNGAITISPGTMATITVPVNGQVTLQCPGNGYFTDFGWTVFPTTTESPILATATHFPTKGSPYVFQANASGQATLVLKWNDGSGQAAGNQQTLIEIVVPPGQTGGLTQAQIDAGTAPIPTSGGTDVVSQAQNAVNQGQNALNQAQNTASQLGINTG